jgi:hypothetical protein
MWLEYMEETSGQSELLLSWHVNIFNSALTHDIASFGHVTTCFNIIKTVTYFLIYFLGFYIHSPRQNPHLYELNNLYSDTPKTAKQVYLLLVYIRKHYILY